MSDAPPDPGYGDVVAWKPERPRLRARRVVVAVLVTGVSLWIAAAILPGLRVEDASGALLVAVFLAVLNAVVPPIVAALRLPLWRPSASSWSC